VLPSGTSFRHLVVSMLHFALLCACALSPLVSAAAINEQHAFIEESSAKLSTPDAGTTFSGVIKYKSVEELLNYTISHDDDDEPMIYEIPVDFAAYARDERERLVADGASPDSIVFEYEVSNYVAHLEGESPEDYAARYVHTYHDMMNRGVVIEFPKWQTVSTVWARHWLPGDGRHYLDLGPESGVTRGEYREFWKWYDEAYDQWWDQGWDEKEENWEAPEPFPVPEEWLKFLVVEENDGWDEAVVSDKSS